MEKNKIYKGTVCAYGTDGEGIIKCEGTTVFVPYCLLGEEVTFKALKVSGAIAYGKLESVETPSKERVAPVCGVYEKCGGCQLQHMSYSEQLSFKRDSVKNALKKIGGLDVEVANTVRGEREFRYRNKLVLPVTDSGIGFYAQRSHRVVPITDCPIQANWIGDIIKALRDFMLENKISGYNEVTKNGVIRHLVIREIKGAFVITLVATKNINTKKFAEKLGKIFENFTLSVNVNTLQGNAIFGNEWHVCHGEGFFTAEDNGIKFKAGANTFLQVNDGVRDMLYSAVCAAVGNSEAVALDLYSGGGMLTAMLAKVCKAAYGIEIVKEASICADELKNLNGLQDKMTNICGKVEEKLGEVMRASEGKERVIVCDPPRKGMERSVVYAVRDAKPEKIVLVSCNPATLARDLGLLMGSLVEENGAIVKNRNYDANCAPYIIDSITPYDMFPQCRHTEALVVLTRKNQVVV